MMKKAVSLLLVVLMIASLSVFALADEEEVVFMPEGTNVLEDETPVAEETVQFAEAEAPVVAVEAESEEAPIVDGVGAMQLEVVARKESVPQGGEIIFDVKVKSDPAAFCAMQVSFDYDDTYFEFVDATGVKDSSGNEVGSSFVSKDLLWFHFEESSASQNVSPAKGDVICSFTLKATKQTVVDSSYTATVTVKAVDFGSEAYVDVGTVTPGSVKIASFTYGDVDGKNGITITDLVQLADYLANFDEETETYSGKYSIVLPAANVNGSSDGKITITDLVLLANYIANLDDEGHSTVVLGPKT